MRRLSWSQLSKFENCPFDWYMNYVKKAVPFKPNIHFTVGSATHAAIEFALGRWHAAKPTVPEMVGKYVDYLKNEVHDPDTIQYWTLCGQNMLGAWYAYAQSHDIQKISVEGKIIKDSFVGIVDCIAEIDGEPFIVDWKTAGKPYTQKQVDTDGQLTAYSWLTGRADARVAYGVLVKGTTKFQFLHAERTDKDREDFLNRLAKARTAMAGYEESGEVPKPTPNSRCNWCALYPELCDGEDDF